MDLVLKLREARRLRGLSQAQVARLSGVGEKTISTFETGRRIKSLKVGQLDKILTVYGLTLRDFFGNEIERRAAAEWEINPNSEDAPTPLQLLFVSITELPVAQQARVIDACALIVGGFVAKSRRVA